MAISVTLGSPGASNLSSDTLAANFRRDMIKSPEIMANLPITAFVSKNKRSVMPNAYTHWYSDEYYSRIGTPTGIYLEPTLTTPVSGEATLAKTPVWVKGSAADVSNVPLDCVINIINKRGSYSKALKVIGRMINGASSSLACILLNADVAVVEIITQSLAHVEDGAVLGSANAFLWEIVASSYAEGSGLGNGMTWPPHRYETWSKIWKRAYEGTGTEASTQTEYDTDLMSRRQKQAMVQMLIDSETDALFGEAYTFAGATGEERGIQGLVPWAMAGVDSDNVAHTVGLADDTPGALYTNFSLNASNGGLTIGWTWENYAKTWINSFIERMNRFKSPDSTGEWFCIAGSGVLEALDRVVSANALQTVSQGAKAYGFAVTRWESSLGALNIMTHPLFNVNSARRNMAVFCRPNKFEFRYLAGRDMVLKKNQQGNDEDKLKHGWLTEGTYTFGNPVDVCVTRGWGLDVLA